MSSLLVLILCSRCKRSVRNHCLVMLPMLGLASCFPLVCSVGGQCWARGLQVPGLRCVPPESTRACLPLTPGAHDHEARTLDVDPGYPPGTLHHRPRLTEPPAVVNPMPTSPSRPAVPGRRSGAGACPEDLALRARRAKAPRLGPQDAGLRRWRMRTWFRDSWALLRGRTRCPRGVGG